MGMDGKYMMLAKIALIFIGVAAIFSLILCWACCKVRSDEDDRWGRE